MKRYIKSNSDIQYESNLSFDFSWKGNTYDELSVEQVAEDALDPYECAGYEFISMSEQYDGYEHIYPNVSQCNITFIHDGNYDADAIETKLEDGLEKLGMCLEGMDFQSID